MGAVETPARQPPVLPRVIAERYKVLGERGRGGMGHVLDVQDTVSYRRAVAKVLLPEYASVPEVVQRFEREAKIMSGIKHPNIVEVYAWGHGDDGRLYIVMELLKGLELADLLREGVIAPRVARAYGLDVLRALDTAHRLGVVHRDIKPGNIFIEDRPGSRPVARVIDFGIAAQVDGEGTQARGLGTPSYMAPEQMLGEPPDVRSDLYSLGLVLYRALTRRLPHDGKGFQMLRQRLKEPPIPIEQVCTGELPRGLGEVIMRSLALEPEHRWQTAPAMADALAWVQTRRSVSQ